MRTIAIDTEYANHIPFLATTVDEDYNSEVYFLEDPADVFRIRRITTDPSIRKIFHQASADIFAFRNIEVPTVPPYEDTMIQASLMNENYAKLGLKHLARLFLGEETEEARTLKQIASKYKRKAEKEDRVFTWKDIPMEYLLPYAKQDPYYTIKLHQLWFPQVMQKYPQLYQFEKSLIPIVVWMQTNGFDIDRDFCKEMIRKYEGEMKRLYTEMCQFLEENDIDSTGFKPKSTKQLSLIADYLKLPVTKKSPKTQLWKMDAEVLTELLPHSPFIRLLVDYRFFHKHNGTYYKPLYREYTSDKSDVAHFLFYQSGPKTGRFSAELVQTFPKPEESKRSGQMHEVRNVVKVRAGKLLVAIDAEQIEMRLFAHFSNSGRMIKGFLEGLDPYVAIAYNMFGEEMVERSKAFKKALRQIGKRIALGIIYGMGTKKLIWSLVHELSDKMEPEVAKELALDRAKASMILFRFHGLYPVKDYMNKCTSEIERTGVLKLDVESARMAVHREYRIPKDKAYKGPNAIIQGTAAYILKYGMIRTARRIQRERWSDVLMRGCVHDELIFTMDADRHADRKIRALKEEIEDKVTFKIPITAQPKVSLHSWGKVKEWDGLTEVLKVAA